jgi:hypothetical protein
LHELLGHLCICILALLLATTLLLCLGRFCLLLLTLPKSTQKEVHAIGEDERFHHWNGNLFLILVCLFLLLGIFCFLVA